MVVEESLTSEVQRHLVSRPDTGIRNVDRPGGTWNDALEEEWTRAADWLDGGCSTDLVSLSRSSLTSLVRSVAAAEQLKDSNPAPEVSAKIGDLIVAARRWMMLSTGADNWSAKR